MEEQRFAIRAAPSPAPDPAASGAASGHGSGDGADQASSSDIDQVELDRWLRIAPGRTDRGLRLLTTWILDVFFRLRTYGKEHIPKTGEFLFCPNHSSWGDPWFQARGQRRLIRYMGKAQIFEIPVVRTVVRTGGGFPVHRGQGDRFAMELARRILRDGQPLCIYAEGTRFRSNDELGPPRRGAARLALQTHAPVIPVATYGSKPRAARGDGASRMSLPRVTTIYGPPMHFGHLADTPENIDRVRDEIWAEVQRMYDLGRQLTVGRRRPRRFMVPPRPEP